MMRFIGSGIAAVCLTTSMAFAQAQDAHVALVKNVTGDVRVLRAGTTLVPVPGTRIMRSDKLVSGPQASAGIVFVDGTTLAVDASSEVEIRRYQFQPEAKQYDFALYLKQGKAIYTSGKLGKLAPDSVRLETPRAAVGVRGTRFIISAE
jgi:hypothetical protein